MTKRIVSLVAFTSMLFSMLSFICACNGVKNRFSADYRVPVYELFKNAESVLIPDKISGGEDSLCLETDDFSAVLLDGNIWIDGLTDRAVQIPLAEFIPLDMNAFSQADSLFKSLSDYAGQIHVQGMKTENVSVSISDQTVSAEKITLTIDQADAQRFLESLVEDCDSFYVLKPVVEKLLFSVNDIYAGSLDRYLENVLYALNEFGYTFSWSRTVLHNEVIEEEFFVHCNNEDYSRRLCYRCYCPENISLQTDNAQLSFSKTDEGAAFACRYGTTNISVENSFVDNSISQQISLSMSGTTYNADIFYTFSGSAYSAKINIAVDDSSFSFTARSVPDFVAPTDYDVLTNDVAGAAVYDRVLAELFKKFPELEKIGLTPISIEMLASDTVGAVIDGQDYDAVLYQYIALQNRDYYSSLAAMNWPEDTFEQALQETITTGQKLGDYINELNKQSYLLIYCVDREFEKLGAELTIPQLMDVAAGLKQNYPADVLENYCNQLHITPAMLRSVYASCFYKQNIVNDYYWGDAGQNRVNIADARQTYMSEYTGVQYIIKYTVGYDSQPLPEDELTALRDVMQNCYNKLNSGDLSIEDAIREYSEDYVADELLSSYASDAQKQAIESNEQLLKGLIIDSNGYVDASKSYAFPAEILQKVQGMSVGERAYLETQLGYWIIQRTDISGRFNEKASYAIAQLCTAQISAMSQNWVNALSVQFNDELIRQYSPENLPSMDV